MKFQQQQYVPYQFQEMFRKISILRLYDKKQRMLHSVTVSPDFSSFLSLVSVRHQLSFV